MSVITMGANLHLTIKEVFSCPQVAPRAKRNAAYFDSSHVEMREQKSHSLDAICCKLHSQIKQLQSKAKSEQKCKK